jgi:hypothetical protein
VTPVLFSELSISIDEKVSRFSSSFWNIAAPTKNPLYSRWSLQIPEWPGMRPLHSVRPNAAFAAIERSL